MRFIFPENKSRPQRPVKVNVVCCICLSAKTQCDTDYNNLPAATAIQGQDTVFSLLSIVFSIALYVQNVNTFLKNKLAYILIKYIYPQYNFKYSNLFLSSIIICVIITIVKNDGSEVGIWHRQSS